MGEYRKMMRFSRPDWRARIMAGQSLLPYIHASYAAESFAACAADVWAKLPVPYVVGSPTFGQACGGWFAEFLHCMFLKDGNRRVVREAFLMTPTKSGTQTNLASLMLTAALIERSANARFAILGPTVEYAQMAFDAISVMIAADEQLSAIFKVRKHLREIVHQGTGATIVVKALDAETLTGATLHGAVVLGLENLRQARFSRALQGVRGALCGSEGAFLILSATQSLDPPAGAFLTELTRARDTRDGKIDGGVLPLIYEPPEGVNWRDPKVWALLHPGFGRAVSADVMQSDYDAAVQCGQERTWAARWLNVQAEIAEMSA